MAKGKKTGGGSRKGSPNKFTKQFKDLLTETYLALEKEKGKGLKVWAEENPSDFYKICAKLVPSQLAIDLPEDSKFSLTIE